MALCSVISVESQEGEKLEAVATVVLVTEHEVIVTTDQRVPAWYQCVS